MNPFDPEDYPLRPTVRRLSHLWWRERRLVLLGLGCALGYTTLSLTISVLIQRAIDHAIVPGHVGAVWPYVIAILGLALVRFWVNFTRRFATARVGVRLEARLRQMLYAGYLRFPRAFYDLHPTGQVVSRATNDLFPIRYFIGWGVVQGFQSAMMIIGGVIVLALVDPRLTLYSAVATPLIGFVAWRFAHLVMPISRHVQAAKGDVTEAADEAVVGIEMVQAFGREDDVRNRFGGKATVVRDIVVRQAGVEATHLPALFFLPTHLDRDGGVLRRPRRHRRAAHDRPVRPLQHHPPAADMAARGAGLDPEPGAACDRIGRAHVRMARGGAAAARARRAARAARRRPGGDVRGRPLRLPGRGRGAHRGRPRPRRRRGRRSLRRDGIRQEHAPEPAAAVLRPDRRPGAHRRRRPARCRARRPARRRRRDHPAADPVLDHAAREPDRRPARGAVGRGRGDVPGRRRRATSSPTSRTATTR